MQDATPLTLGQEWLGYAAMLTDDLKRIDDALVGCGRQARAGERAAKCKRYPVRDCRSAWSARLTFWGTRCKCNPQLRLRCGMRTRIRRHPLRA
jgi:Lyase